MNKSLTLKMCVLFLMCVARANEHKAISHDFLVGPHYLSGADTL